MSDHHPRGSNVTQLRSDIDRGLTGDRSPAIDPAAAPLGTDEEAGGAPPSSEEVDAARAMERRPNTSSTENSPSPEISPTGAETDSVTRTGFTIAAVSFAVLVVGAAAFAFLQF